jgi:hypothetical protein
MSNQTHLIFTDESGAWGNRKNCFYIRSWLKTTVADLSKLEQLRENNRIDILKLFTFLDGNGTEVFFTITFLDEFYTRKFVIRDEIAGQVNQIMLNLQDRIKEYMKKIPRKVEDAINYVMFLHVYEKFHIMNAYEHLKLSFEKDQWFFEKPQFNQKDYRIILEELGIKNYKLISKSKINKEQYNLGIKIADRLASSFNKIASFKSNEDFNRYIVPRLCNDGNILRGVNKVFMSNLSKEFQWAKEMNKMLFGKTT